MTKERKDENGGGGKVGMPFGGKCGYRSSFKCFFFYPAVYCRRSF